MPRQKFVEIGIVNKEFKYLMIILKIFGLLPLRITKRVQCESSFCYKIYLIFLLFLIISSFLYCSINQCLGLPQFDSFPSIMYSFGYINLFIAEIIAIIASYLYRSQIIEILEIMHTVNINLNGYERQNKKKYLSYVIIIITIAILFRVTLAWIYLNSKIYLVADSLLANFVLLLRWCHFASYGFFARDCFKQINKSIKTFIYTFPNEKSDCYFDLNNLSKSYFKLCTMVYLLVNFFSIQNLNFLINMFVETSFLIHYCIKFKKRVVLNFLIFIQLFWPIFLIFLCFVVVNIYENIRSEVRIK